VTPLLVVDTETTGGSTDHHQLIEVAAIAADADTHVELWRASQCIRLESWARLEPRAMAVHGHPVRDPAWHARARPLAEVLDRFAVRVGTARYAVVGHNLGFDLRFLRASYGRCGQVPPHCLQVGAPTEDTQTMAMGLRRRGLLPATVATSLTALCMHFGIPNTGAHRALRDAERTLALRAALRAIVQRSSLASR
jgi:DNA polymerase III epsilon subunit-like protein